MDNDFCEIMDAPLTPQPDWITEEEALKIEMEIAGLEKTADQKTIEEGLKAKRQKEQELLNGFLKSPSKDTFMPLYSSYKPWVIKAAHKNMHNSTIPKAAHMALAAQSFLDATRTYDPSKGSFRQHAFNTVFEKGKRLNLKYQNIGYIPESRATKYQAYQQALHILREDLGREPSAIEVADESGIPVSEIEKLQKEVKRDLIAQEHLVSRGMGFAQTDKALQVARDIIYSLEPKHQVVLEYMVGLGGKPSLVKKSGKADIAAIAKAAGVGINDVRSARKTIKRKFSEYRSFMGQGSGVDTLLDESED